MTNQTEQQERAELKPCPFCGSCDVAASDLAGWETHCYACGASGPIGEADPSDKQQAIALWNTRALLAADKAGGEVVAQIVRNEAGQIRICDANGDAFDMSKHIGAKFYTQPSALPNDVVKDAERFKWSYSDAPKDASFMNEFLRGVRKHWTLNQWRDAIDAAMRKEGK